MIQIDQSGTRTAHEMEIIIQNSQLNHKIRGGRGSVTTGYEVQVR
jgi:hypothetical protein